MYAILGEIQFDLITYFDGFELKSASDFAEHAVIEGKPRLQFIGDALDEVSIRLKFHAGFCDPETEMLKLRDALTAHQALALVFGNGDYKGWFVITELNCTSEQTDSTGAIIAMEANLSLKEFVGDKKNPLPPPAIKKQNAPVAAVDKPPVPAVPTLPTASADLSSLTQGAGISALVAGAGQATAALSSVTGMIDMARGMIDNPLSALNMLPGIIDTIGGAIGPLSTMSSVLDLVDFDLPDISALTGPVNQCLDCVQNASAALGSLGIDTVKTGLDYAGGQVKTGMGTLESSAPTFAGLAAQVTTRMI